MIGDAAYVAAAHNASYPPRAGNAVRPLVDGVPAFRRICEAVESARHSVWVTVAYLERDVPMPDGRGSFFDVLDRAAVRGLDVRALFWREPRLEELEPDSEHFPGDAENRAWLAERALRDSVWVRELVDAQGSVGAIVVDVASSDSEANVAAYEALDAALAPHERRGFRFHRVGGPVEFVVAGGELQADTAKLVPVMVVLVGAVLALLFHSLTFVCVALATVGLGVLWTFGLLGWLGWPQNTVSQALPPLLLVIGVCDVIHLLARYANDAGARPERDRATLLEDVAGDIGTACVATSLTTASGFASFATSGLESFVRFGAVAAFGVIAALILTFTLLPILAVRLRPNGARALRVSAVWSRVLERIVAVSEERAATVLALTTVLGIGAGVGVAMLRVDASFEDLYGEGSRVVRWSRFVGDALRRPDSLEVEIEPPVTAPLEDPATLEVVAGVQASLADVPGIGPARSVIDVVSLAHQLANDDESFWYRVPSRRGDVREIYDVLTERDAHAIGRWLDEEGRRFRISIESEKPPQEEMRLGPIPVDNRSDRPGIAGA